MWSGDHHGGGHLLDEPFPAADDLAAHEFDDTDQARGRSCYTVLQPGATGIDIVVTGRYHDTFRRVDGRWRFASRDYTFMDFTGDTANHLR